MQLRFSFEKERVETLEVERFDISRTRGFLPERDPVADLPPALAPAEKFGRSLPLFLSEEMFRSHFRRLVLSDLPPANLADLAVEDREMARAIYRTYAFLASAYVHTIGELEVTKLPPNLALPLWFSAWRLGKPPILSYDGYALWNWKRKEPAEPLEVANLETIQNFVMLPDESGFILPHVEIEAEAAPAIVAVGRAQQAVLEENLPELGAALLTIAAALAAMLDTLEALAEYVSPEVFYRDFRPYIMSFGDQRRNTGIVFEGVNALGEEPQFLNGETGAQSSVMPSLVAALGVKHAQTGMTDYLLAMENYMPVGHREFIRAVRQGPSIREFAKRIGVPAVTDAYNECLEGMNAFRRQHLSFAIEYIHNRVANPTGTGGTPFMKWLSLLAEETIQHRLP